VKSASASATSNSITYATTDGQMVPLSSLGHDAQNFRPEYTNRFNVYRAAQVIGGAAPGYSFRTSNGRARRSGKGDTTA